MSETVFAPIQAEWRRQVSESWAEPPKELYHYTSGSGLHGILSSNSLWGGNYAFMNDRSEFSYGRDLFASMVADRLRVANADHVREILRVAMEPRIFEAFDLYLTCFCEESDLLSQWRGYGGQDSRYCLRFATANLKAADDRVSPILSVIYDVEVQRAWLEKALGLHEAAFGTSPPPTNEPEQLQAVWCLAACALPVMLRFKSPAFREEREWRSVRVELPGQSDLSGVNFVNSGGVMKPFRTLLRGRRDGDSRLPLLQVIAGASRSELQSVKSAWLMVRRFGYETVPIAKSLVPLAV